jgi:hypothetical protein
VSKTDGHAYSAFEQGLAFGAKELERVENERMDVPGAAPAIDLGGSGLTYDQYGFRVEAADDPFAVLEKPDLDRYGPPAGTGGSPMSQADIAEPRTES